MAGTVQCELCPTECVPENYQVGGCRTRIDKDGMLHSLVYGKPCAVAVDPIEKKPFYHFLPATKASSINAVAASSQDPRFVPMRPEELADREVEITVLSPLEPLGDVKDIRIGTHGICLTMDRQSSVFLPQVPVEQEWYLEQLRLKAGLHKDAWKDKAARLSVFSADSLK